MFRKVVYWFIISTLLVVSGFFFFSPSLMSDMVIFIWVISGIASLYIAKNGKEQKILTKKEKYLFIGVGLLVALASFANYFIAPWEFWNPPYSLGEFGVLLSGLSIALFAYMGWRKLLIPAAFPAFVLFCAQIYDTYQGIVEVVAQPLLGPTTGLVVFVLNLIGIKAVETPGYILEFLSQNGSLIKIQIVIDCTGIWSLSAFTASLLIVSIAFPHLFSKKNAPYIIFGYIGTYAANILRVVAICLSSYLYGYSGNTIATHEHAGWIAFSGWMLIFWYLFFSRQLLKKEEKK
jgi:exosortase/archaeosortase family protein